MRALLACEKTQAVCKEFRFLGVEAYSCDIEDSTGGFPKWHIKGDVLDYLFDNWDIMIGFPPCTHLAISGSKHFKKKIADGRQQEAIDFFMKLVNAPIPRIAIENPVGIMSTRYRKPDQIIQPYYFGDPYQKTTCLWLKNLPKLVHIKEPDLFNDTVTHTDRGEFIVTKSGKRLPKWYSDAKSNKNYGEIRSRTFTGIARAMAEQWNVL